MSRNSLRVTVAVAVAIVLCAASARATVILDDYSSSNPGNYTLYNWYGGTATFAVSNGQLQPNQPKESAHVWYWTGPNGERMHPGDSVSVDVANSQTANINANSIDSFVLGTTTTTTVSGTYFGIQYRGDLTPKVWKAYILGAWVTPTAINVVDGLTLSTLTLTRGTGASQNVITWSLAQIGGYGLAGSGTATLTGVTATDALYFGPGTYYAGAGGTSGAAYDNLTYTPIPEPSTLVLLGMGLVGLLCYAWRKRK